MLKKLGQIGTLAAAFGPAMAFASEEVAGKPVPAGTGFQRPVTEQMADLVWLDDMLLVIITLITLFVTGLLLYTVWKFDARKNPTPARFTHNATIEVIWTAVPVVILVIIAIPSLRLLDKQMTIPETELTIKAIGNQWYWDYEYPDSGVELSAVMLERDELEEYGYEPDEYLLATDTRVVVPVNTNVHLLVTAGDVIHNWAMPSFGIKTDAIPGRVNEAWFNVTETGTFFGQCSELCGMQHAYMPIVVEVVTREEFDAWIAEEVAKKNGGPALAQAPAAE
ncbi:MAG: cytochrome c oxidase subunit II [Pseudomonadota bacterium]